VFAYAFTNTLELAQVVRANAMRWIFIVSPFVFDANTKFYFFLGMKKTF
jgi:hypothetical protein